MIKLNIPKELKKNIKNQGYGRILAIYDHDKTFDRYSVYFNVYATNHDCSKEVFAMSDNPCHPQGFGQWCSGFTGRHNGKSISFDKLPKACQDCIINMFNKED